MKLTSEGEMLLRKEMHEVLKDEAIEQVMDHYFMAHFIRLKMPPAFECVSFSDTPSMRIPSCHVMAHAFARTFSLTPVDGEHAFIERSILSDEEVAEEVHMSTYIHSWIEIEIPDGEMFILDLFPDKLCPILPVLHKAPHPAYWVPKDRKAKRVFRKLKERNEFWQDVETVAEEMKKSRMQEEMAKETGKPPTIKNQLLHNAAGGNPEQNGHADDDPIGVGPTLHWHINVVGNQHIWGLTCGIAFIFCLFRPIRSCNDIADNELQVIQK